jgi:hypothetical protein
MLPFNDELEGLGEVEVTVRFVSPCGNNFRKTVQSRKISGQYIKCFGRDSNSVPCEKYICVIADSACSVNKPYYSENSNIDYPNSSLIKMWISGVFFFTKLLMWDLFQQKIGP